MVYRVTAKYGSQYICLNKTYEGNYVPITYNDGTTIVNVSLYKHLYLNTANTYCTSDIVIGDTVMASEGTYLAYDVNILIFEDSKSPLCFTRVGSSISSVTLNTYGSFQWEGQYSYDCLTWYSYYPSSTGSIRLDSSHPSVYFKGTYKEDAYSNKYLLFTMKGAIEASGNTLSLCSENTYTYDSTLPCEYCFYSLFKDCTKLTAAPALPTLVLKGHCYARMFSGCTSLTTPPSLPATSLAEYCYHDLFYECTSLTTAPALPATSLPTCCYYRMFLLCSALTTVPELPAITLGDSCYGNMFHKCTSLYVSNSKISGVAEHVWHIPKNWPATYSSTGGPGTMFMYCLGTRTTDAPDLRTQKAFFTQNDPV